MTKAEIKTEAMRLPERERFLLAQELRASIEDPNAYGGDSPPPRWQRDLIDERLEASNDDPGQPWEEIRAEIRPEGSWPI